MTRKQAPQSAAMGVERPLARRYSDSLSRALSLSHYPR